MILTNDGIELLNKVNSGALLKFSRMAIGSGDIEVGTEQGLDALVQEVESIEINFIEVLYESVVITGNYNNSDFINNVEVKELGLYAIDPNKGEILYAVENKKDTSFVVPKKGTSFVENTIQINIKVSNVNNVEILLDNSLVYITKAEFNMYLGRFEEVEKRDSSQDKKILDLESKVRILEDSIMNGMTSNHFREDFEDLIDIELENGIYDPVKKKIYI